MVCYEKEFKKGAFERRFQIILDAFCQRKDRTLDGCGAIAQVLAFDLIGMRH